MLRSSWHWCSDLGTLESQQWSLWLFPLHSKAAVTVTSICRRSLSRARSMRCRESSWSSGSRSLASYFQGVGLVLCVSVKQAMNREVLESIQDYLRERQVFSAAIAPLDWVVRQTPK